MIKDKLRLAAKGVANPGSAIRHISKKTRAACCNASVYYNSIRPIGTPVFSEDWDMLVILDTCRPDILRSVQSEYDFLTEINTIWSTGAMSAEWMATTFDRDWTEKINNCGYITANPHSKTVLENNLETRFRGSGHHTDRLNKYGAYNIIDLSELGYYKPVWESSTDKEEDHDLWGDPRKVTEAAIQAEKCKELDQIILHYMPPHFPYIGEAVQQNRKELRSSR